MEPEGLIESNWDEVRMVLIFILLGRCRSSQWSNTRLRGKVEVPCSNLGQAPWGSPRLSASLTFCVPVFFSSVSIFFTVFEN
jgi:hypothetical protein